VRGDIFLPSQKIKKNNGRRGDELVHKLRPKSCLQQGLFGVYLL
jgi:hypothetical protein